MPPRNKWRDRNKWFHCFFDFFARRFQQEFQKFSQQHTADMAELKQAHEAEMAASHAREEANLTQVNAMLMAKCGNQNQNWFHPCTGHAPLCARI